MGAIPDTGSVRQDLLELAREILANVSTPEMNAVIRAFVAEAPRESALASRGREFWADRFAADRQIVQRAIARGELPADADPDLVIEALLGPLYVRLLTPERPSTWPSWRCRRPAPGRPAQRRRCPPRGPHLTSCQECFAASAAVMLIAQGRLITRRANTG